MQVPDGEVLQKIRTTWPEYRKQARMLILMDVSASMSNRPSSGSDLTKLDMAKAAATRAIEQLAPTDQVGLWTFSSSSLGDPYARLVPIESMSKEHRDELDSAIADLRVKPGNASQLFTTVEAAAKMMFRHFNETEINGIILLSDGPNDGSTNTDAAGMLRAVQPKVIDREVRVFTIAYGDGADSELLQELASASLGTAYDAVDATRIGKVFPEAVANF
jgi:Ca-activated chloride channel family protein